MSRTQYVFCQRCDYSFLVEKDEGDTAACPQCCCEFDVEWFTDQDGENARLVAQNIALVKPKYATISDTLLAVQRKMESQMGIPPHLVGSEVPRSVDADRFYAYVKKPDLLNDHWECAGVRPSILVQAQFMGMRVFNNRKRMRKRVRQRRRHWSPYDDHWSQHPGDW
jgi:hypothetical protein